MVSSIPTTHLQLLTKIRTLLDHLLADIQISLHKIKGHSGHDGNDRADNLAKAGVTSSSNIGRLAYPIRAPLSDTIRVSTPPLFEQLSLEEQATALQEAALKVARRTRQEQAYKKEYLSEPTKRFIDRITATPQRTMNIYRNSVKPSNAEPEGIRNNTFVIIYYRIVPAPLLSNGPP